MVTRLLLILLASKSFYLHTLQMFNRMRGRFRRNKDDKTIGEYAELLLGYSLLAEGSELPDSTRFNRLLVDLMLKTL